MQVVAYALLLEDHGITAARGWVYYAEERRRVPVTLNASTFAECRLKIGEAKALAVSGTCPPPLKDDPRCLYCSGPIPFCLPNESHWWARTREAMQPDPQLSFPFATGRPDMAHEHISEATEFAAVPPRHRAIEAPRPRHDDGEVVGGANAWRSGRRARRTTGRHLQTRDADNDAGAPGPRRISVRVPCSSRLKLSRHVSNSASMCPGSRRLAGTWAAFRGFPRAGPMPGADSIGCSSCLGSGFCLRRKSSPRRSAINASCSCVTAIPHDRVSKTMAGLRNAAGHAGGIDELLGIEGAAAALYFEQFLVHAQERRTLALRLEGAQSPSAPRPGQRSPVVGILHARQGIDWHLP